MLPILVTDRYEVLELLGQGGMGRVWKARDRMLQRDVAIKEIVPPPGLTDEARQELRIRSLREARAIARLDHPHAVRVFDVLLGSDGDPQIVMEYVPSRSLHEIIATDGPVPPVRAAEIGLAVLGALRAAHRAGIMHRDVKPANILVGTDGRVVLTDFGLATAVEDVNLTLSGVVLGSPAYVSPERAMSGTVGPQGDFWSLGATLFAAVEGQSPYARPSSLMSLAALVTEPPPAARHAGPLAPVLTGLLRKDPTERMDADTAERLLRAVLAGAPQRTAVATPSHSESAPTLAHPTDAHAVPRIPAQPAPDADGPVSSARAGRGRPTLLLGGLAALLALGLVIGIPLATRGTSRATGSGAELVDTAAPGAAASAGPSPTAAAGGAITWSVYRDSSGFAVPAPRDWRIVRRGHQVEFHEPDGDRVLLVSQTDSPRSDPLADVTRREKDPALPGRYRDYRRIEIVAVNYQLKAADWEWVYTGDTGTAMHARQRTFTTGKRKGYSIVWSTPDAAWAAGVEAFREVTGGFRPASAPAGTAASAKPNSTPSVAPSAAPRTSGHRLVGAASDRCLDVTAPESPDPVRVRLWDCRDDRARNQLWTMRADGSVQLGGRCLDVVNASSDDGAPIQLTTCNTTPAQQFTLNEQRQLVNAHSGMCLGGVDLATASGALIEQRTCDAAAEQQKWSRR
ncbi:Serine/threonine protein kinase [Micromonospora cremea]|uniref:non-specific serine/threonine protein kinase n=1 Tax=Micromonospora cremea TaxID=709881 RepID=A0A1N5W451_9ACTN|nr:Serine/threonine protein kinase [Micromonospora cremea]